MHASYNFHELIFKVPGGTSRGILKTKPSWFITIKDDERGRMGIGECSIIPNLSPDKISEIDKNLTLVCTQLNNEAAISGEILDENPAINFAVEMAIKDFNIDGQFHLFKNKFLEGKGIPINGLIWMGEKSIMLDQIKSKIKQGYQCIKLKIAALDFKEELSLIKYIRKEYSANDLEIRVDANGGLSNKDALEKLQMLSEYQLHSIEQPIMSGQWEAMAQLCIDSPIDIALDEELIGISGIDEKHKLLKIIAPAYIILKPSLLGGFEKSQEWIHCAESNDISWWVTSALETNVGLNAIAQWTYGLDNNMYQGLGTGQLFSNNIISPLFIDKGYLYYGSNNWNTNKILSYD